MNDGTSSGSDVLIQCAGKYPAHKDKRGRQAAWRRPVASAALVLSLSAGAVIAQPVDDAKAREEKELQDKENLLRNQPGFSGLTSHDWFLIRSSDLLKNTPKEDLVTATDFLKKFARESRMKMAAVPMGDTQDFEFGKDYLRIYVEYLYLPSKLSRSSLFTSVETGNKDALKFDHIIKPEEKTVYSDRGRRIIIPYVALNAKAPLHVTTQLRVDKDLNGNISIAQSLLEGLGNVVTGGALGTISRLTQRATALNAAVQSFENATSKVDENSDWILDQAESQRIIQLYKRMIVTFTDGKGRFDVKNDAGQTFPISERNFADVELDVSVTGPETPLAPTAYRIKLKSADSSRPGDIWVRPVGKQSYAILHFEKYTPYPGLVSHPEQVNGIKPHFDALRTIFEQNRPAPSTTQPKLDAAVQKLIDAEGDKLVTSLETLTEAGDVSLADAITLIDAFCRRAGTFAGADTGFEVKYLMSKAVQFQWSTAP